MAMNFLYKNIRWTFNQNPFDNLICLPTTEKQYLDQLEKLARNYYPATRKVDTLDTEFCMNRIALLPAKNDEQKVVKSYFRQFWTAYERVKGVFDKSYAQFPACDGETRLERICELVTKCTQFATDSQTLDRLVSAACNVMQLTGREIRYLPAALDLYKIKYYCAAASAVFKDKAFGISSLARMLEPTLLKQNFTDNDRYSQSSYGKTRLISVVDCMGNSATQLDDVTTKVSTKIFVYANGRNVFDTFVKSRFGQNTAEFASVDRTVDVTMRYYLQGTSEVRKLTITNKGKTTRKFSVDSPLRHTECDADYFYMGNATCLAAKSDNLYVAYALVRNNEIVPCNGERSLNYDISIAPSASVTFDLVTVYAHDTPTLAQELNNLEYFGSTRCPYLLDGESRNTRRTDIKLNLTSHGYELKKPRKIMSERLNYTYQLGDNNVATFIDNAGNSATLIKGFVFGVKGESVYVARQGLIEKINDENFRLDVDKLCYGKRGAQVTISHEKGKTYDVNCNKPCKVLFYFPFEKKSKVSFANNCFSVADGERRYDIKCVGEIESYTTNALECNEEKLRYKLSGNIDAGTCLAVCFATTASAQVAITSADSTPESTPIVRESLVSTYLNYINDKNTFCLVNKLKRPDSLTIAAICYTNPKFVKQYLLDNYKTQQTSAYYDASGQVKTFSDKLAFPLAYAYYRNLVGDDLPKEYIDAVNGVILGEQFEGLDLCVKALILKKIGQLNSRDKVRYLVEYNTLKKKIVNDSKLYAYAQAIGAVPLTNPSKARLKDLCNKYLIPKCWYYVSQLENLYGLSISSGKLLVSPRVTAENVLEQFALNIDGKRIDTTFSKATVQSMTLNGAQCYQPFYPASLKNVQNELVVRY